MKCILSFVAEGVIRDATVNNISAYNILERFSSPGFPFLIPKLFFFSLLEKESESENKFSYNLVVKNNEQVLIEIPIESDFQDKNRNRQIVEIGGLVVPYPGKIDFTLYEGSKILCSYSIEIVKIGPPQVDKIES
ncbi:MAG: hypothetical protein HZC46_10440 [Ignavibacterium album]|uniref:hypothetical protein n=1 Tax=Ignavibacterium album TaxID=591197 RepID=UPI0026EF4B8B|nr:hypothetical protein [Ignavibacterium album]MBI5662551.1 hypothetical protein [Ignavibacterium album]